MMKIIATENGFFAKDEDGVLTQLVPDKNDYCRLPANNSSNRTWIKRSELIKINIGEEIELPYHNKVERMPNGLSKYWQDYLTDEERDLWQDLYEKGQARMAEAKKKQPTEEELLEKKIKVLEEKLAKMKDNFTAKINNSNTEEGV